MLVYLILSRLFRLVLWILMRVGWVIIFTILLISTLLLVDIFWIFFRPIYVYLRTGIWELNSSPEFFIYERVCYWDELVTKWLADHIFTEGI